MRTYPALWKERCCISHVALVVLAFTLAFPGAARAVRYEVDCSGSAPGAYTKIQDAVNALPEPLAGQGNVIHISGECTENVTISGQHRLWLGSNIWDGPPFLPPAKITGVALPNGNLGIPLTISGSQDVNIENLILTGGQDGLDVVGGSSVTGYLIRAEGNSFAGIFLSGSSYLALWDGHAKNNGVFGIEILIGSTLDLNGNTPWVPSPQPFLISGNGVGNDLDGGIFAEGGLGIAGGVIIEHNSPNGIYVSGTGKNSIGAWHDQNLIRNNSIGVWCDGNATCGFWGRNIISENDTVGVQASNGAALFITPTDFTTIEGNGGAGVEVTARSVAYIFGSQKIRNNGSGSDPRSAGIRVDGTSQVTLAAGAEVSGNMGPGIFADINSSLDITDATIGSNTGEGIRLRHMSIAEVQGSTAAAGNTGGPLTCDSTSWAITALIPKTTRCANIEGAPSGPKPRGASTLGSAPNVGAMMQQARQMAERSKARMQ